MHEIIPTGDATGILPTGAATKPITEIGTPAIRNLIREGKIAQMYSAIQTGQTAGMQTLDQCLTDLVKRNLISMAEARGAAANKENFPG
jgi:twitching motility protein PilT